MKKFVGWYSVSEVLAEFIDTDDRNYIFVVYIDYYIKNKAITRFPDFACQSIKEMQECVELLKSIAKKDEHKIDIAIRIYKRFSPNQIS